MPKKSAVMSPGMLRWKARLARAESFRKKYADQFGYTRALQQYQGDFKSAMPSFVRDADLIPINEVYSFAKAFTPSVYSRDPYISVNPTRGGKNVGYAKMLELGVNAYWRELRLKREFRRAILDAVFAEGILKVGYSSVFGSIEAGDGPNIEESEFIKNQDLFACRVPWENVIRDPDAVNGFHDARYVIHRLYKPLEAVKGCGLYDNTKDLKATIHVRQSVEEQKKNPLFEGNVEEYVELLEIWDMDEERVRVMADGHDSWLAEHKWPYKMDGYPFVLLRFNENPDHPYAPNLICSWEPQLWEKIKLRAMQLDHLKRFNRMFTAPKGTLSKKAKSDLKEGRTGTVIETETDFAAKGGLQPIPYPPFQQDAYPVEGRIDLDKDNVSGQPNAVRSAPQKTQSRTLGEIDRLIAAFNARQSEPQALIEEASEEVAYKLIGVMQQHLPGKKFVRATSRDVKEVVGAIGKERFDGTSFYFTKEDISKVEFEVNVKAGSTLPQNREGKIQSMIDLLKLGPTIGIQPGGRTALILGKNLIEEFDMPEVTEAYKDDIAAIEAQKQVAMEAMKAKLALTERKIDGRIEEVRSGAMGAMEPMQGEAGPRESSGGGEEQQ